MSFSRVAVLFLAIISAACAQFGGTSNIVYANNPKTDYKTGMEELRAENFEEAIKYFTHVKTKFPFSTYATLADLAIGDAYFAQEKFLEAVDAYKLFLKFHPTHPKSLDGYVAFRIGHAYVKQIPSDFFILPPSHEKDQSSTRDALRELSQFLDDYPQSKYLSEATKLYHVCIRKLVEHELYVAQFYLDQDKPKATIFRLEGILATYPEAGADPQVMLLLGKTYLKLKDVKKAKETFASLVERYPKDYHSEKAKLYLDHLKQHSR